MTIKYVLSLLQYNFRSGAAAAATQEPPDRTASPLRVLQRTVSTWGPDRPREHLQTDQVTMKFRLVRCCFSVQVAVNTDAWLIVFEGDAEATWRSRASSATCPYSRRIWSCIRPGADRISPKGNSSHIALVTWTRFKSLFSLSSSSRQSPTH